MILAPDEIRFLLSLIRQKYGPGYSGDERVGKLQAKLSIMLQAAEQAQRNADQK